MPLAIRVILAVFLLTVPAAAQENGKTLREVPVEACGFRFKIPCADLSRVPVNNLNPFLYDSTTIYECMSADNLYLMIICFDLKKPGSYDAESCLTDVLTRMEKNPNRPGLKYKKEKISLGLGQAWLARGQYLQKQTQAAAEFLTLAWHDKNLKTWFLTIEYGQDNENSRKTSQKILDSIRIE